MNDLIDREQAIDAVSIGNLKPWLIDVLQEIIKEIPSAEKTGKWLDTTKEIGFPKWTCSACGGDGRGDYKFCPWCGARMDLEGDIK